MSHWAWVFTGVVLFYLGASFGAVVTSETTPTCPAIEPCRCTEKVTVKTTGYCPMPPCVKARWADGITASGVRATRGTCASDIRVYPFGTTFDVPGYGSCTVQDTGNGVRGHHLDLYFPTYREAKQWGVQYLEVERRLK